MAELKDLPIEQLRPMASGQPRKLFDEEKLRELAESYRISGILQPIVVRQIGEKKYEIVAGERRWRAAPIAGMDTVPCLVKTDDEIGDYYVAAVTENIQRADMTPVEEAMALKEIRRQLRAQGKKGTQGEIAKVLSKSLDWVKKTSAILGLSDAAQSYFRDHPEELSKGHANALRGLEPRHEMQLIEAALSDRLTVRALEKRAQKLRDGYNNAPVDYSSENDVDVKRLASMISEKLGCEVEIKVSPKSKAHEMTLRTWGSEAFEGILEHLSVGED